MNLLILSCASSIENRDLGIKNNPKVGMDEMI